MKITITALRGNIFNTIKRLKKTGELEITHKGKVVATLSPVKKVSDEK